jgi:hypothetical protein
MLIGLVETRRVNVDKSQVQSELDKINQAIAAHEALRGSLSDDNLDVILAYLQQRKVVLTSYLRSPDIKDIFQGKGAAAQGPGSKAAGERGVIVDGSVGGNIITGSGNTIYSGAAATDPVPLPSHLASLRDRLAQLFDKSELNGLCFDLGIAADDLPGETRTALAQALVAYCYRRQSLPALVNRCRVLRPHTDWTIAPHE